MPYRIKKFQLEDLSRAAVHDGLILAWSTGLGKSLAAFCWPMLKLGVEIGDTLKPKGSVLIVAPGDLHNQLMAEGRDNFAQRVVPVESQEVFLKYSKLDGKTGRRIMPNGFYITSYEDLTRNGVQKPEPIGYEENGKPIMPEWYDHVDDNKIKCVLSPSLADLSWNTFDCMVVDEGVRMKGDATRVGKGIRQMNPKYRLVLTATPIKNRMVDIFFLAHWAAGGKDEASARFPYEGTSVDKHAMAEEFMVSERNLTKEGKYRRETGKRKRFEKLTPQVTSIQRLWKLLAPTVLRRRKEDCGEEIPKKIRRVVRVPLGKKQAAVYAYHMSANYEDKNGKPAIGAKLQALRVVASDPTSQLLGDPGSIADSFNDKGEVKHRSNMPFTPKIAAAINLITQILQNRQQVVVFSAFHDGLDALSRFLTEAGVRHTVLDGRLSQKKRGALAAVFKNGPPKASSHGKQADHIPVQLAGIESCAEGFSWHLCKNVIFLSYSWAMDKVEQAMNRIHRINSPADVDAWSIICDGSVDRVLEHTYHEKAEASELVLDGRLQNEAANEVNLAQILAEASDDFANSDPSKYTDEAELLRTWPELKERLRKAALEWYRPVVSSTTQAHTHQHQASSHLHHNQEACIQAQ